MKSFLLLFFFLILGLQNGLSTHLMGGEITATIDSAGNGIVTLILYRDGLSSSAIMEPNHTLTTSGSAIVVNRINIDTIATTPSVIERHTYQSTLINNLINVSFIQFRKCCRGATVKNIYQPQAQSVQLRNSLYYSPPNFTVSLPSSTPVFLGKPIVKFPKDTLWTYNPTAFDADGDSLYFKLAGAGTITGYSTPPANPGGDLAIDSLTGEISWNASQTGEYVVGFQVEEWRDNGSILIKIGEIYREMLIAVVSDTSQLAVLPATNVSTTTGIPVAWFTGDSTNEILVPFYSPDTNAVINMEAFGAPFEFDNSDASFTITKYKKNTDTLAGVFSWTPQAARKNNGPYLLTFRATNDNFSRDFSVLINVNSVVGIEEFQIHKNDFFNVFPNPSNGNFNLKINETFSEGFFNLKIFDTQGQKIINLTKLNAQPGEVIPLEMDLKSGLYFLQIESDGKLQSTPLLIE